MRRALALMVCMPLALLGQFAAHQSSYLLVARGHGSAALLADTGHGYLEHAPLGVGILLALMLTGLAVESVRSRRPVRDTHPSTWSFALLGPATFVVQEHLERFVHNGEIPWGASLEPTFLLGLLLQLPVALLGLLAARALLRGARSLAGAITGSLTDYRRRASRPQRPPVAPADPIHPTGAELLCVRAGRAPPIPAPC